MFRQTGKLPQALANKPHVSSYGLDLFEAFWKLNRRRGESGGLGGSASPLSVTDIRNYGEIHLFDDDEEFFLRVMSELDDEFLDYLHKESEKKRKTESRKKPKGL